MALTITKAGTSNFVIKKSRFIGFCNEVKDAEAANNYIKNLWEIYPDARHICYAYRLSDGSFRYNDDGEPSGTAGRPIFSILEKNDLVDTILVSVRYFGGIKLGPSGLIKSYRESVDLALQNTECIEYVEYVDYEFQVNFVNVGKINNKLSALGINYIIVDSDNFAYKYSAHIEADKLKLLKEVVK